MEEPQATSAPSLGRGFASRGSIVAVSSLCGRRLSSASARLVFAVASYFDDADWIPRVRLSEAGFTEGVRQPPPGHQASPLLDVAVKDGGVVRGRDGPANLSDGLEGLVNAKRATGDAISQRLAIGVRHGDEQLTICGLVDLVDGKDVGVVQCRRGLRLVNEPLLRFCVLDSRVRKKLEGNRALQACVERFVHDAHAAGTQHLDDFVV
jgi:hypothetical protein